MAWHTLTACPVNHPKSGWSYLVLRCVNKIKERESICGIYCYNPIRGWCDLYNDIHKGELSFAGGHTPSSNCESLHVLCL